MMLKTKLARAITMAVTGTVLTVGGFATASADVTTMYNLSTSGGDDNSTNTTDPTAGGHWGLSGGTDGWTNGNTGPSIGDGTGAANWAGTSGANNVAFGYTGAHLNWGFEITGGQGGSGEISTFDAFNRYGVYADIDTSKGAWAALNTGAVFGGWRHDLDVGLFKSDSSGLVTLNVTGILEAGNFGFTIFKGVDSVTYYNHHGQWNNGNNTAGLTADSLPWVSGGVFAGSPLTLNDIVAYSVGGGTPSNLNTISFNAEANQIYTIFLGGYKDGNWGDTNNGYRLTISQVPVPGAVWMMGSGLMGLLAAGRKKRLSQT
ncbi:MAG: hypothetical protein ACU836_12960 [Gammaproteobacteria bacterium]